MSFTVDVSFVQQFEDMVHALAQQKESRFRNAVRIKTITGKAANFERLGPASMTEITTRHADTVITSTPHSRRKVSMRVFAVTDLIDETDEVQLLISPESEYAQNFARAMNRQFDDLVIAAFNGNAFSVANDDTVSTVALGAGQLIANGGTGMTIDKWLETKQLLDEAEVDEDDRHIAFGAQQVRNLLQTTQIGSSDFNTVQALARGQLNEFLGFMPHRSERLPLAATIRSCFGWQRLGLGVTIAKDMNTQINIRADKNNATQVQSKMVLGATRIEEVRVVQADCVEV